MYHAMRATEKIMEYARLCGASYKEPSEMREFLTSDATGRKYIQASYRDVKASGFQCYLLKDRLDGSYVFAFRGTEFVREPVKDTILTDARMMLFGPPPQMYDALAFAAEMQKRYGFSEDEAVCTGHSLGGTLAAMTGYVFGFEAYAFNPYGIGKLTASADGDTRRCGAENIAEHMKKLGVTVRKNRETIHSFVNIGMFEQDFVAGLLTSATASHHVGSVHYLKDAPGNWFSIADKHTIGKTLENLGEQRWADESEARNYLLRRCEEWLGCGDLPRAIRTAFRPRGNAELKRRSYAVRLRIKALQKQILRKDMPRRHIDEIIAKYSGLFRKNKYID